MKPTLQATRVILRGNKHQRIA